MHHCGQSAREAEAFVLVCVGVWSIVESHFGQSREQPNCPASLDSCLDVCIYYVL